MPRLTGPFNAVGMTAEYLVIMIFLIAYELLHNKNPRTRMLLYVLMAADIGLVVATGNRGGFLSLLGGSVLFLWVFRKDLGLVRSASLIAAAGLFATLAIFIVLNYTQYNHMFERLSNTEIEGGIPDSRQGWKTTVELIKERPILGHGPQLRLFDDWERVIPGHTPIDYPHNLYLFLLYTVGIVGVLAYLTFFIGILVRVTKASKLSIGDAYLNGFLRLGQVLVIVFLVDQLKVEFLRISLTDYWQFVFCVFAILVGAADLVSKRAQLETGVNNIFKSPIGDPHSPSF